MRIENVNNKIVFNADDENPDCNKCDNVQCSYLFCESNCGADHGWNSYNRTEIIDSKDA